MSASGLRTSRAEAAGVIRVGVLNTGQESAGRRARAAALRQGIAEQSLASDRQIALDFIWAGAEPEATRLAARALVEARTEVLVGAGTSATAALMRETRTLPIVFVSVSDPIGEGFAASYSKPGGNATGLSNFEPSMTAKWLELLEEIAPGTTRPALLFHPKTAAGQGQFFWRPFSAAAASLNLDPIPVSVDRMEDVEAATVELARQPGTALAIAPSSFTSLHGLEIASSANRRGLPTVFPFSEFARGGGLISYGAHVLDLFRRAGSFVIRIANGEHPADLPVEAPTHFELVVNARTAKMLGLAVPPLLLARADEVIE
ncbi:ABC transporter substrate-binding protein (plasmid) [Methylobacterium sp. CB376]|uniref:ABC transporter substrate-binding protein n=1 Tax=unclassified Methylobacterium TaxID=2615210 RepID=UPI00223FF0E0|nr:MULTISPECIES: ABC transporter substrate-binding protein [Methylobacterium]WFT83810.1 ABC transporter substrate-binding protein [Methylobacterium nodulans]